VTKLYRYSSLRMVITAQQAGLWCS